MEKFKNTPFFTALFYVTLFLMTCAFCVKFNILDYDLWSRLLQGYGIINNGSVMYHDPVSYTETHIWYDPEWLSSALMYLVVHKFGGVGLVILKIILMYSILCAITLGILALPNLKEKPFNICYYLIILTLGVHASIVGMLVRCQLFTFIFLALWILILEKVRQGRDKLLILLPFIMLLWLNTHGGSIAGVGILFLYALGEALNAKPFKKYLITFVFVCLAFLINPWGADFIKFMIESSYLDRSWIAEWQSSFGLYHFLYHVTLLISAFCYIFSAYKNKIKFKDLDKTKLIVLLVLVFLSLKHIKHIGLYIIGFSILMYDDYFCCYHYFMEKLRCYLQIEKNSAVKLSNFRNIFLYIIIIFYSLITILINPPHLSYKVQSVDAYPFRAVEFLKINNFKGNIFAPFFYSGYIAYRCYPELKIYMDGRQEQVYSTELFDKQMLLISGALNKSYKKIVDGYKSDIIMAKKDLSSSKTLKTMTEWKQVYEDDKVILYAKEALTRFNYKDVKKSETEIVDDIFNSYFK